MGAVRGIKGQVKEHERPDVKQRLEPVGRKKPAKDYGVLVTHDCRRCMDPVLAPERIHAVTCGRCTLLTLEHHRERGNL